MIDTILYLLAKRRQFASERVFQSPMRSNCVGLRARTKPIAWPRSLFINNKFRLVEASLIRSVVHHVGRGAEEQSIPSMGYCWFGFSAKHFINSHWNASWWRWRRRRMRRLILARRWSKSDQSVTGALPVGWWVIGWGMGYWCLKVGGRTATSSPSSFGSGSRKNERTAHATIMQRAADTDTPYRYRYRYTVQL